MMCVCLCVQLLCVLVDLMCKALACNLLNYLNQYDHMAVHLQYGVDLSKIAPLQTLTTRHRRKFTQSFRLYEFA